MGNITLARLEKASIARILKDLATTDPDLFRDAIIEGLQAPPPRSFPYLMLAAQYIDGKARESEPPIERIEDLSMLTREGLRERAEKLVRMLSSVDSQIIDVTAVADPDDLSPEQLQEELRRAQAEVDKARAEVERLKR